MRSDSRRESDNRYGKTLPADEIELNKKDAMDKLLSKENGSSRSNKRTRDVVATTTDFLKDKEVERKEEQQRQKKKQKKSDTRVDSAATPATNSTNATAVDDNTAMEIGEVNAALPSSDGAEPMDLAEDSANGFDKLKDLHANCPVHSQLSIYDDDIAVNPDVPLDQCVCGPSIRGA